MGWAKFQNTLSSGAMGMKVDLSEERCQAAVNLYRSRNYNVKILWAKMDVVILAMLTNTSHQESSLGPIKYGKGYIRLPNGLFLQYYGLHGEVEARRDNLVVREATYLTRMGKAKIYGGLLTENVVQALSRCIIGEQILKVSEKYRVVTTTHDEIVAICKKKDADKCLADMLEIMSTPPDWAPDLPLAAEGGYDVNYSK